MDALELETGPKLWWLPNFFTMMEITASSLEKQWIPIQLRPSKKGAMGWLRQNRSMGVGMRSLRNDGLGASFCWTL
jgi:hypothetical protein